MKVLARLPYFAFIIGFMVRILTYVVTRQILESLVKVFTGFHDRAVKTTTDFLSSPLAVEQAL